MHASLASMWMLALLAAPPIETRFAQVAPADREAAAIERSANEDSAVLLIQGLCIHPFSDKRVAQALWQGWQKSDSPLVEALAKDSDVFALAYSQNVPVEEIAESADLAAHIRRLKELGYTHIVLVGHSAGGIIARQFVENHPDAGVTKVIQVCAPNGGSGWSKAELCVRRSQEAFLNSLTKRGRQTCLQSRGERIIPDRVEFVCLVGQLELQLGMTASFEVGAGKIVTLSAEKQFRGDGIVSSQSQWPSDLQDQRVPAVPLPIYHMQAMRDPDAIQKITELSREPQPRLTEKGLADLRRLIFGQRVD